MKHSEYILLCCLALLGQSCVQNKSVEYDEPVKVTVQKISYSSGAQSQVYTGRVEAGKTSIVTATYPGHLESIKVRTGQKVKKGQTLAYINSPSVNAMYESSKATYDQAKDALNRVNQVYENGGIPELKLVEVQTSYSKAESAYKAARTAKNKCRITAPYEGIIGDILVQEGVEVTTKEPLFRFLDISTVEIHASIPENEYALYKTGSKAMVQVDAVGVQQEATLKDKGFEASPLSHSYDFVFKLRGKPGNMMPGMVCKVYLTSDKGNTVIIPASSVSSDTQGRYVWCIAADSTVVKRQIAVDGFSGDGIIVREGLEEGDLLIVEGGRKVSTGMKNIVFEEIQ